MSIDLHAACPSPAFQQVTCDRCKRKFKCTPWDDFYCAADGDHCCELCLIAPTGVTKVAYIDLDAPLAKPVFHTPSGGPS
jgi:hypothetical protein